MPVSFRIVFSFFIPHFTHFRTRFRIYLFSILYIGDLALAFSHFHLRQVSEITATFRHSRLPQQRHGEHVKQSPLLMI